VPSEEREQQAAWIATSKPLGIPPPLEEDKVKQTQLARWLTNSNGTNTPIVFKKSCYRGTA